MYFKLVLTFFILSKVSYAISDQEILDFSKTKAWKNLLYYENNRSIVTHDNFFTIKAGRNNPYLELKNFIQNFNKDFSCRFPARILLLQKFFPIEFKNKVPCKEYLKWKDDLDVGKIYYVYSSSYPNNPASTFGHTFLRFDRKKRSSNKKTNELLGYSIAFMANADPRDNPIQYTLKGVFGGYQAYSEIKPYYVNLGIYNNSESRDIWEFELKLNKKEKDLFIAHLWELSTSGSFNYKFATENCSSLTLKFLRAIRKDLEFNSLDNLFIIPLRTYKELANIEKKKVSRLRPSILNKLNFQIDNFSPSQKSEFKKYLEDGEDPHDDLVIQNLIQYYKFLTYKHKTNISYKDQVNRNNLYLLASKKIFKDKVQYKNLYNSLKDNDPLKSKGMSKVSLNFSKHQKFGLRYGFYDFSDSDIGRDGQAFINFFDLKYNLNKKSIDEFTLIDILSIRDFNSIFKNFSWQGTFHSYIKNDKRNHQLKLGLGGAKKSTNIIAYALLNIGLNYNETSTNILFGPSTGLKYYLKEDLLFVLKYENTLNDFISAELKKEYLTYSIGIKLNKNITSLFYNHYF